MASRLGIGAAIALAIAAAMAATAPAQQRLGQLRERAQMRQALPSDPNPTRIERPGTYRFHFTHAGRRRDYLVHLPASAIGRAAPVVIALHGGGGDMDQMAAAYGLVEKAEAAGFVLVAPSGTSRLPSGILATWNAGACCGRAAAQKVDDVGFIRAVVARSPARRRSTAAGCSPPACRTGR